MVTVFRTSEMVTVSELLAPGSCASSFRNAYSMVRNGTVSEEKTEAASCFSETVKNFITHPYICKTSETVPFILTKWYRFGSLTVFLPQFFLDQDGNLQAKGCYEIKTYACRG